MRRLRQLALIFSLLHLAVWAAAVVAWRWTELLPLGGYWIFFPASAAWTLLVLVGLAARQPGQSPGRRAALPLCLALTYAYLVCWHGAVFVFDALAWDAIRGYVVRCGSAVLFLAGLAWTVWIVERASQRIRARRIAQRRLVPSAHGWVSGRRAEAAPGAKPYRAWNPLDTDAWYYGRKNARLHQSFAAFLGYCLLFFALALLWSLELGRAERYELPAGGGERKALRPQSLKIQKVKRIKYVVNPFSPIKLGIRPVDDVKLQLAEVTAHTYTVGYGDGKGAGFGGGTARGKVRFIRLEYSGGDWDEGKGIGGDQNMLLEYGVRTRHPVADRTESRRIIELANFPEGKSPPLVYLTGQKDITLTNSEVRVLNEYLLKKHGMIFGDNGGSRRFHSQFLAMMHRVLPNVTPVSIPLDDAVHRIPYPLPFLPYASPHGGREALGWWVDGRWVCYYHPGDIGDAWCDDHAGVREEVWEACYQLGTNVIFYAHAEYSQWLQSRGKGTQGPDEK